MEWALCGQIVILMLGAALVLIPLMLVHDEILKVRKKEIIHEVAEVITREYLPKVAEVEIEMTDRIMDKICDKIPDVMEKTMKSAKTMMEE